MTAVLSDAQIERVVRAVHKAASRQARRDAHIDPMRAKVSGAVATLAHQVAAGSLTPASFVPAASGVLTDGYSDAYTAGSAHASDDFGGDPETDWDDEAADRADKQRPFLATFGAAILAGMSTAMIDARSDLYGETLTAPYEEGYVTTGSDTIGPSAVSYWRTQDDPEVCDNCDILDGEMFDPPDSVPFWPGDGAYGDDGDGSCLGGGRCRCSIELSDGSDTLDTSGETPDDQSGARANFEGPATADEARAQGGKSFTRSRLTKSQVSHLHKAGNPQALIDWYNDGADGQIDWGSGGDFDACVDIAGQYMDSPEGFCSLRHQDAVGGPPGSEDKVAKDFGLGGPSGVALVPFDLSGPRRRKKDRRKEQAAKGLWASDMGLADRGRSGPDETANAVWADPVAAGLAVRAEDTGRVLVLQRAWGDDDEFGDPAAGKLEFAGGHLEADETPFEAACREWSEEVGCLCPPGRVVAMWTSRDGIYVGFVMSVPYESDVHINLDWPRTENPDAPVHAKPETAMWMAVEDLIDNPAVRAELALSAPWYELRTPLATVAVGTDVDVPGVVSKSMVNYRRATDHRRCGTCSMYSVVSSGVGECTLVTGAIDSFATCNEWDPARDTKSVDRAPHKGPLEHRVHDYLRKHYPEDTTEWVCRSAWEKNKVPLDRISYTRRPGGRDMNKVAEMVERLKKGWKPDRVVLVDQGTAGKMVVADGYHRLLAMADLGETEARAWVGTPRPGAGNWKGDVRDMQAEVLNRSGSEDATKSMVAAKPPPPFEVHVHPEVHVAPSPAPSVTVNPPQVHVAPPAVEVHVDAPPPADVHVQVAAPSVEVHPPEVTVQAPNVTVEAPAVTVAAPNVEVHPPDVHVDVAAPSVTVEAPVAPVAKKTVRAVRGPDGSITIESGPPARRRKLPPRDLAHPD